MRGRLDQSRTGADWTDLELLVVDDEESVRNVAAKVFRRLGSDVTEAADGVEAVERFETAPGRYSAVVLDLTMPRMDGHDALAAMRRMRSKVPVVLMSGYDLEGLRSLPVLGGPTVFLKKPFTPEELQDAVLDVLQ